MTQSETKHPPVKVYLTVWFWLFVLSFTACKPTSNLSLRLPLQKGMIDKLTRTLMPFSSKRAIIQFRQNGKEADAHATVTNTSIDSFTFTNWA